MQYEQITLVSSSSLWSFKHFSQRRRRPMRCMTPRSTQKPSRWSSMGGKCQTMITLTHVRVTFLPAVSLPWTQTEVVHLPDSLECQTSIDALKLSLLLIRAWCSIKGHGISKGTTTRQRGQTRKRLTSLSTQPGEGDGSGARCCLIGFSQRCRYGKPRGELPSDKPDLHRRDKTAWWSRWKMASRINGLGKMLTQSDGYAAVENKVGRGIHAQADGEG